MPSNVKGCPIVCRQAGAAFETGDRFLLVSYMPLAPFFLRARPGRRRLAGGSGSRFYGTPETARQPRTGTRSNAQLAAALSPALIPKSSQQRVA